MREHWRIGAMALLMGGAVLAAAIAQDKKGAEEPRKPAAPEKKNEAKPGEPNKPGEAKPGEAKPGEPNEEMMKRWQQYATPGENHKLLDPMAGQWRHEIQGWMEPNAEPMTSAGTSEFKWMFGKRYMHQTASAPAEGPEGPFEGAGMYGYDNARKQHFSLWMDNMGTGVMMGYGTAEGKKITYRGEDPNPLTGKTEKWRGVLTLESADRMTYEWYGQDAQGKEFRKLLITYTRAKEGEKEKPAKE